MNGKEARAVVLISADAEWEVIRSVYPKNRMAASPFGGWFPLDVTVGARLERVPFFHGGWGKIAAAVSTQYCIDTWSPELIVNLGTCGGFAGKIEKGTIILVDRTIVYDIHEQMGDYDAHIAHYTTRIDLSWLGEHYPQSVVRGLLISGDRDIIAEDIPGLAEQFGAVAADWESGAIAYVARRNGVKCLILRGVSDLVGVGAGEAYEDINIFIQGATEVLTKLLAHLPAWLSLSLAN